METSQANFNGNTTASTKPHINGIDVKENSEASNQMFNSVSHMQSQIYSNRRSRKHNQSSYDDDDDSINFHYNAVEVTGFPLESCSFHPMV